ncbi:transcriptional regulator STERILE APETALA-like [Impatiens glandulifera]|uniref:transcriptional regulator STERILE APETALA-like n=1 Tax=Impatiens glandulifera TaxID=253017 RepID=UPI001FB179AA|nr:transcriptional regulator STERILE APETALA-like [Impatiens glandulifera]
MSSSSSSSSSDEQGSGNGNGNRGGDYEGPSASRRRFVDGVWPEPFVESLAYQVAIDASNSSGRLAAGPALFNLFQVCSTWREVSRSELLWQNLTGQIWNRHRLPHPHTTWREEFIFRHRTARNFRSRRYHYSTLHFNDNINGDNEDENEGEETILSCRRLVLSDNHLAAGFSDGCVRLFSLPSRVHLSTFRPHHRDRLGRFSRAVSGIILSETRVVFASHDGDIHVAPVGSNVVATRRSVYGDVLNDGALVDFCGSNRKWVGLYAGVPGRAFHVWNGESEELIFVGGTLTDPEAVMGWHLLTDLTEFVGRVRVTNQELAIACTSLRVIVFDLGNLGFIISEEAPRRGVIVGSVDTNGESLAMVDNRGLGSVRLPETLQEVCRFMVRGVGGGGGGGGLVGCMNLGYVVMCGGGGIVRVWSVDNGGGGDGEYLYGMRERIGGGGGGLGFGNAITADERHVAAWSGDLTIHLWDFGAR